MAVKEYDAGEQRPTASILHVDMDSFFVAVELLERPELRGRPTAVGNDTVRSVISSASYEARKFGVRSAMPVSQAKRLCPQLVLLDHHMEKYRDASLAVMAVFREFTPLVEQLSVDEAFLDVAGAVRLFGPPRSIAEQIRVRVRERTGLPASVGLAGTKHIAKLASQRAKPDGILEIHPTRTLEFLAPLPVSAMWGVGAATAQALQKRAIHTVAQLAEEPLDSLKRIVGAAQAAKLFELSRGRDPREVHTERVEKSVGHEKTFAVDERDHELLERELLRIATCIAARLRRKEFEARTIALKVRWSSFDTVSRSRTLSEATDATQRIYQTLRELYGEVNPGGRPVRLIGGRAEQLIDRGSDPAGLWSEDEHWRAVDQTVDEVHDRFGVLGLTSARLLPNRQQKPE